MPPIVEKAWWITLGLRCTRNRAAFLRVSSDSLAMAHIPSATPKVGASGMDSDNRDVLTQTWALIACTRCEILQLRSDIQTTLDSVDHSRQLLSRTALPAQSTGSAHDSA